MWEMRAPLSFLCVCKVPLVRMNQSLFHIEQFCLLCLHFFFIQFILLDFLTWIDLIYETTQPPQRQCVGHIQCAYYPHNLVCFIVSLCFLLFVWLFHSIQFQLVVMLLWLLFAHTNFISIINVCDFVFSSFVFYSMCISVADRCRNRAFTYRTLILIFLLSDYAFAKW